jgi:hypothetical protein
MDENGQLHASAALPPWKEPPVPIGWETGRAPQSDWTLEKKKVSNLYRESKPGLPARSLIDIPSTSDYVVDDRFLPRPFLFIVC